jgi:hypothetical protein
MYRATCTWHTHTEQTKPIDFRHEGHEAAAFIFYIVTRIPTRLRKQSMNVQNKHIEQQKPCIYIQNNYAEHQEVTLMTLKMDTWFLYSLRLLQCSWHNTRHIRGGTLLGVLAQASSQRTYLALLCVRAAPQCPWNHVICTCPPDLSAPCHRGWCVARLGWPTSSPVCICVHVCMCMCAHLCMRVCMCAHACTHIHNCLPTPQ